MNGSQRVAARYRLFLGMSLEEAKTTLGLKDIPNPTPEEILKAYRRQAIRNHPDHGGSNAAMVAINIAKEILDGKVSPDGLNSYTQRPSTYNTPPTRPERKVPEIVKVISGVDFHSAVSKGGVPANVEWKIISKPQHATLKGKTSEGIDPGYSWNSLIWTLIGKNDQRVYVVSLQLRRDNKWFDAGLNGLIQLDESWEASLVSSPLTAKNLATLIPKLAKSPGILWSDGTVADPPKKWVLYEAGKLDERQVLRIKYGSGGAGLKDVLAMSGLLGSASAESAGPSRKSVVEIIPHMSRERGQRIRKEQNGRLYNWQLFEFEVRVNGKSENLSDDTIKNLDKAGFIMAVTGYDPKDNVPKLLNRVNSRQWRLTPGMVIGLLADNLTSEPSWLHIALEKAREEWE